jgi:PAS domain S-box-containing protein
VTAAPSAAGAQPLRVLYLEDCAQDAEIAILELERAGYVPQCQVVSARSEFLEHLRSQAYDLVLADYRLPDWTGLDALKAAQEIGKDVPFILVSGTLGDEIAVECVKQGAWDYVLKDRITRLGFVVTRALRTRQLLVERAAAERERDRLLHGLVERERKYRELFELVNEAIVIFEPTHEIILEANPFACQMYGYGHDELLGSSLKRLTRDVERGEEQIGELLTAGSWQNFETVHVRRDGSPIHLLASGKVIDYAGQPAILTVNRDVTELKSAEDALRRAHDGLEKRVEERTAELALVNAELRRSRDEWQSTFDCMHDALTVQDAEFHILRCNRAFQAMFPDADLGAVHCYELVHGLDRPPETCPLARTLMSRHTELCEFFEPHLNRYLAVRTDPMFDEDGRMSRIVHVISDISERKEIERMKNEFVSRVSHELRTPLSSLRGFAELMLEREYPADKRRHFLEVIQRESERLGRLINDVLDLQRIESGRQVLRLGPVSLSGLAAEAAETFASGDPRHRIVVEVEGDLPPVRADADSLRQALNNLVSNALKYSPDGGEVRVGARLQEEEVLVWVSDQGVGIPAEALPHIFSKFYRVDNTVTRKIGGTGLGLALVKDIVELHGGRVWAESQVQKGSVFYFTLQKFELSADAAAA